MPKVSRNPSLERIFLYMLTNNMLYDIKCNVFNDSLLQIGMTVFSCIATDQVIPDSVRRRAAYMWMAINSRRVADQIKDAFMSTNVSTHLSS